MHRLVELHAEVNNLIISPAMTATIAHQRIIIDRNNTTVASIIANSVLQVDDDASIVAATREGETIESSTLSCSHLSLDVEAVQYDLVIARLRWRKATYRFFKKNGGCIAQTAYKRSEVII